MMPSNPWESRQKDPVEEMHLLQNIYTMSPEKITVMTCDTLVLIIIARPVQFFFGRPLLLGGLLVGTVAETDATDAGAGAASEARL